MTVQKCFHTLSLLFLATVILSCGNGSSDDNSEVRHRVFITSNTYSGDLGGLDGADSICTAAANTAGIPGSYKAIISGVIEGANSRIEIRGEIYLVEAGVEVLVADNADDFWRNDLEVPINVNENGARLSSRVEPWTGTSTGGFSTGDTCLDWKTSTAFSATTGDSSENRAALWLSFTSYVCSTQHPLYCIEE